MIERITQANGSIQAKKLEEDFQNHLKFKKNLKKSQPLPVEKILQRK